MKQATLENKSWAGLSFRSHMITGADNQFSDPLITQVCGNDIDYGHLFAYCFRRFGYPSQGWDGYKQLVSYYLTTPNPDMVLNISPSVENCADISLRFLVSRERLKAIDDYAHRDRTAWRERALAWAESKGLPAWMEEWLGIYNTEYRAAFPNIEEAKKWQDSVEFFFPLGEVGTRPYELTKRVADFRKKLDSDYEAIEPFPAYYERPANWNEWFDDDPLKPLAEAAVITLTDLFTPVGIRDAAINAFGPVDTGSRCIRAVPSAGYPCGSLGNDAPEQFAELQRMVLKLGRGNAKKGIKKLMENLT